jgi:ribosome-binding ATPase YchF (GTP1/OBG family)
MMPRAPNSGRSRYGAGLNRVIRAGYELLKLHTYFTAGPTKCARGPFRSVREHRKRRGDSPDFESLHPRRVIGYEVLLCGWAPRTRRGRLEGGEYVVADGDVMHFRFNV